MAKKEVGEFQKGKGDSKTWKIKNVRYCPKVKRGINFTDRPVPYPTNTAKLNKKIQNQNK